MDHNFYRAEDLASDESFQEYVFSTNAEATQYWEAWLEDNPEHAHTFHLARQLVINLQFRKADISSKKSFDLQQLQHRIQQEERQPKHIISRGKSVQGFRLGWWVAAGFTLILGLGYGFWKIGGNEFFKEELPVITQTEVEQATPRGQKQTVHLPDGTQVKLNAESTLRYAKNFDQRIREVYLTGEAYFEVAHDTLRPFVVYAGGIETKVLGTSFNLRAYPDEHNVDVALVQGKVEVYKNDFSEILKPAQMISFDNNSQAVEIKPFDSLAVVGWKDWVLFFKDADINEIKYKLERWYDVKIEVRGNLKGKAFSGKFINDSLEEVLKGISFSLRFQYEISNGKVIIQST